MTELDLPDLTGLAAAEARLRSAAGLAGADASLTDLQAFATRVSAAFEAKDDDPSSRLRVPAPVAARIVAGLDGPVRRSHTFLLPPVLLDVRAVALDDREVVDAARAVVDAWRGVLTVLAERRDEDPAAVTEHLEGDAWLRTLDPGDFLTPAEASSWDEGALPQSWRVWDHSVRAALASLEGAVPIESRMPLLLGLWSAFIRAPKLAAEWEAAEAWIASGASRLSSGDDLASARVWAMSTVSPLYATSDRDRGNAFAAWAYARSAGWATYSAPDAEIHERLRREWSEPPQPADGTWPDWVRSSVSSNRLARAGSRPATRVIAPATPDELLQQLDPLAGLATVKQELRRILTLVRHDQARSGGGKAPALHDLNMVFFGNPGTGKTTVARTYAAMLRAVGALETGVYVEISPAQLMERAGLEAAEKTLEALDAAAGGVLFVDEAHVLGQSRMGGAGREVLDTLVAELEKRRGRVAVVLAGYLGPMQALLKANPGLQSRFRDPVLFPDLSENELVQALFGFIEEAGLQFAADVEPAVRQWLALTPRGDTFGNAREMRRLVVRMRERLATRFAADPAGVDPDLLVGSDVPSAGPMPFRVDEYVEAMSQLHDLAGLDDLKLVLEGLAAKAQLASHLVERGKEVPRVAVGHFVFAGNPGTGKTTAARLLGRVLKAAGLLESGHVHEVGPEGLIGRYLGETPQKVIAQVDQALDGVLFVDEAYSLVAKTEHYTYSQEALATLVAQMETHRSRLVVVLAGYPKPMKDLLAQNEGLRSRISTTVAFPDFTRDELRDIALGMVRERGKGITDEAADALADRVHSLVGTKGFGNARTMRDVVEKAEEVHAMRVMAGDAVRLSEQDARTITLEDVPEVSGSGRVAFGFG